MIYSRYTEVAAFYPLMTFVHWQLNWMQKHTTNHWINITILPINNTKAQKILQKMCRVQGHKETAFLLASQTSPLR